LIQNLILYLIGNGAPDIFSAIAAAASDDNPNASLAFGQLLGGAMFITSIVVPTIIMFKPIYVEIRGTLSVLGFYLVALTWLSTILLTSKPMRIWQPLGNIKRWHHYNYNLYFSIPYHLLHLCLDNCFE
jgi:Ca2+/Na+ antiporter